MLPSIPLRNTRKTCRSGSRTSESYLVCQFGENCSAVLAKMSDLDSKAGWKICQSGVICPLRSLLPDVESLRISTHTNGYTGVILAVKFERISSSICLQTPVHLLYTCSSLLWPCARAYCCFLASALTFFATVFVGHAHDPLGNVFPC